MKNDREFRDNVFLVSIALMILNDHIHTYILSPIYSNGRVYNDKEQ